MSLMTEIIAIIGAGTGAVQVIDWYGVESIPGGAATVAWKAVGYNGTDKYVALGTTTNGATSTDGINWDKQTILSATYSDIAYGNGKWVAATAAQPNYSADGVSWTASVAIGTIYPNKINFANGQFVGICAGTTNTTVISTDGVSWLYSTLPVSQAWSSIAYGNGVYVATSSANTASAAYSTDGIMWKVSTLPSASTWTTVTFGTTITNPNGIFVTVASTSGTKAATSTNGINWAVRTLSATSTWASVAYGQPASNPSGLFVAVSSASGTIASASTDGITWTPNTLSATATWNTIAYGNGKFIATAGAVTLSTSTNAISWTTSTVQSNVSRLVYGSNGWLGVAINSNYICKSTDGLTWTGRPNLPSSIAWNSAAYGNNTYVAVSGVAGTAYSTNGINWRASTLSSTIYPNSLAFGNGVFVGTCAGTNQTTVVSTDGADWYYNTLPLAQAWSSITYGNGVYVAVSSTSGTIAAYSTNGLLWKASTIPTGGYISVAFGTTTTNPGGIFVATCATTITAAYSTNGINWTNITSTVLPVAFSRTAIVYGQPTSNPTGVFLIHGYSAGSSRFAVATDGINWSSNGVSYTSSLSTGKLSYGNGRFVLSGGTSTNVLYSTDCTTWIYSTVPTALYTTAYGSSGWLGLQANQYFLKSVDGATWTSINDAPRLPSASSWVGITYGTTTANPGGIYVAISNTSGTKAASSTNGINWTATTLPANGTWVKAVYGTTTDNPNGLFVTTDTTSNSTYSANSTDGINWSLATTFPAEGYHAVKTFAFGKFLCMYQLNTSGKVYTSTNGINWASSQATSWVADSGAFGTTTQNPGGIFVTLTKTSGAAGYTTTNSVNWVATAGLPTSTWASVAYGTPASNPTGMFVGIASTTVAASSTNGINWVSRTLPVSSSWIDVVFGSGKFVAISTSGFFAQSTNGITWTSLVTPVGAASSWRLSFENSLFILVSTSTDETLTSSDAITWYNARSSRAWSKALYANGVYYAISSTAVTSSTDLINWTPDAILPDLLNNTVSNNVNDAVFNDKLVAISNAAATGTSTDGINWYTSGLPSTSAWFNLTYGKKWVAVSNTSGTKAAVSDDGISWTASTLSAATTWANVKYGTSFDNPDGIYVAVGNAAGSIASSSTNGINWTARVLPAPSAGWSGLGYGKPASNPDGLFVAARFSTTTGIAVSTNGITWTVGTLPVSVLARAITYGNNMFTLTSSVGTALTSTDAITWTIRTVPTAGYPLLATIYANDTFTVVPQSSNIAMQSTDFINWVGTHPNISASSWNSALYANNSYYIVADTTVTSSTDLVSWTPAVTLTGTVLTRTTYGDKFVSISGTTPTTTSTDAITWTQYGLPSSTTWAAVTEGDVYVAVSNTSGTTAARSTDGVNWNAITLPVTGTWISVAYGNGAYVAVSSTLGTNAVRSTDSINWAAVTVPSASWSSVTYGNNGFLAVSTTVNAASTDGITWTTATLPYTDATYAFTYDNIVYFNGRYSAVASGKSMISNSTDGINWASNEIGQATGWGIIKYVNSSFVAFPSASAASFAKSTDGANWSMVVAPRAGTWVDVVYNGSNKYVVISSDTTTPLVSTDLISWSVGTLPDTGYVKVIYGSNTYIGIKQNSTSLAVSTDGITWNKTIYGVAGAWDFVVSDGSTKVVAIKNASNTAAYSADSGDSWISVTLPNASNTSYTGLAYSSVNSVTRWVALSTNGNTNHVYSTNGINWALCVMPASLNQGWTQVISLQPRGINGFIGLGARLGYSANGDTWVDATAWQVSTPTGLTQMRPGDLATDGAGKYICISYSYVASNYGNGYATSTNGLNWSSYTLPIAFSSGTGVRIAYGNNSWVITDKNTTNSAYSIDGGSTWTTVTLPQSANAYLEYSTGTFRTGYNVSTNGANWTSSAFTAQGVGQWGRIATNGAGIIVAVKDSFVTSTTAANKISVSLDHGRSWSAMVLAGTASKFYNVQYLNNQFIITGNWDGSYTSPDAVTWTFSTGAFGTVNVTDIAYDGTGKWVIVDGFTSRTGIMYGTASNSVGTAATVNATAAYYVAVAYGNGRFVVINSTGAVYHSTDAITWVSASTPGPFTYVYNIKYVNGKFFALGWSKLGISTDGINWSSTTAAYSGGGNPSGGVDIAYGLGKYVTNYWNQSVGYTGMKSSTDLVTWVEAVIEGGTTYVYGGIGVTFSGTKFQATANGSYYMSTNGTHWGTNQQQYGNTAYGNGVYGRIIYPGYIHRSTDGINWAITTASAKMIVFGNGKFVVKYGDRGTSAISTDLISWTSYGSNWGGTQIDKLLYGNGMYVALSYHDSTNPGSTSSTDGVNWRNNSIGMSSDYAPMIFDQVNGYFLQVAYLATSTVPAVVGITNQPGVITWAIPTGWPGAAYPAYAQSSGLFMIQPGSRTGYKSADGLAWTTNTQIITSSNTTVYNRSWLKVLGSTSNPLVFYALESTGYWISGDTSNGFSGNTAGTLYGGITNITDAVVLSNDRIVLLNSTQTSGMSGLGAGAVAYTLPTGTWSSKLNVVNGKARVYSSSPEMILESTDGVNWTKLGLENKTWTDMAYGSGRYVLVSASSTTTAYSSTGLTWTTNTTSPLNTTGVKVAYGSNKFIAVAPGTTTTGLSTNGITWTTGTTTLPSAITGQLSITHNGVDSFVVVGGATSTSKSFKTTDGITWTTLTMSQSGTWAGVAFGATQFVAISSTNNIPVRYPKPA